MTRKKKVFIGFGLFLTIILCLISITIATGPGDNMVLSQTELITDDKGNSFINGTLTNKLPRSFTKVEINFSLLNNKKETVGNETAKTDFIPGGKSWEFKVPFKNKEVVDFKVTSISTNEEEIKVK